MQTNNPEHSIGFVIYEVYRLMCKDIDARIGEDGLTQAQWRALAHLSRLEGCNQTVLAEQLDIRPITLTRLIDKLVEAGWVQREPDPDDRRAVRLFLTESAQPMLSILRTKGMQTREKALAGFNEEEASMLFSMLEKMKTNLSQ